MEGRADAARPGHLLLPAIAGRTPICWPRNPPPQFTTQAAAGGTSPFAFDVMGDWGMVDTSGNNPDQARLDAQMAASGARFTVTVGDNGYNSGNQLNYGDLQQTGDSASAIFGPSFWTVAGSSIPLFTAVGNHGLSGNLPHRHHHLDRGPGGVQLRRHLRERHL